MVTSDRWAAYDDVASTYEDISVPHYFAGPAERLVSLLDLGPESALLDVGSGTGVVARAARKHARFVVAGDASLPMLSRSRPSDARLLGARLPDIPVRNHSFTHATASFVLSHLSDPVSCLIEVRRALHPDGLLGVTSWAVGPSDVDPGRVWSEIAGEHVSAADIKTATGSALPGETALASMEGVTARLAQAGFGIRTTVREALPVAISLSDYLASRSIGVTARYIRATLSSEGWRQFESAVRHRMEARFGQDLRFRLSVNFIVGTAEG